MSYLRSLSDDATLLDVFKLFPRTSVPLIQYHEILMRGKSSLSPAERELIAAYVSGLNSCGYCHGIHRETARRFGIDETLLKKMLDDFENAPVKDKMRALLVYVGKLTRQPDRMTKADAELVYDAGWDESALHDAVSVCALFNFMNRLVEGLGIVRDPLYTAVSAKRLHEQGYTSLIQLLRED